MAPDHPLVQERAAEARDRILARPEPEPSQVSFLTSLTSDAYLASSLPVQEAHECLEKVLSIATDARETASSRHEALVGATALVLRQDLRTKRTTFAVAEGFVSGIQDGSHLDDEVTGEPHPLSAVRISFGSSSLRGHGLKLAEAAATDESAENWVRDQAIALLRSTDEDDVIAAATVLVGFSEAISSPIDLVLLAGHPNIQVRQACAILCSRHPARNRDLLLNLATDPEYRVRLVLAGAVAHMSEDDQANLEEVRNILKADRRHCVRAPLQ